MQSIVQLAGNLFLLLHSNTDNLATYKCKCTCWNTGEIWYIVIENYTSKFGYISSFSFWMLNIISRDYRRSPFDKLLGFSPKPLGATDEGNIAFTPFFLSTQSIRCGSSIHAHLGMSLSHSLTSHQQPHGLICASSLSNNHPFLWEF